MTTQFSYTPSAYSTLQSDYDGAAAGAAVSIQLADGTYQPLRPWWFHRSDIPLVTVFSPQGSRATIIPQDNRTGPSIINMTRPTVPGDFTALNGTLASGAKLDSTADGFYTYRLHPGTRIQSTADGIAFRATGVGTAHDFWSGLRKVTFLLAFVVQSTQTDTKPLAGLLDVNDNPSPVKFDSDLHVNEYTFRITLSTGTVLTFRMPSGSYAGVLAEVIWALDLDAGTVSGWVNNVPQTVTTTGGTLSPGASLLENQWAPYCLYGETDLRWLGHSCFFKTLYTAGSNPPARLDGNTDDSKHRYFYPGSPDYNVDGEFLDTDGFVEWHCNTGFNLALYLDGTEDNPADAAGAGLTLVNLDVQAANKSGPALLYGNMNKFRAVNCTFSQGSQGVGGLPGSGVSYPVRFQDCTLTGIDCGLFAYGAITFLSDTDFGVCGRHVIRSVSSNVHLWGSFASQPDATLESYVRSEGGGDNTDDSFIAFVVDDEDSGRFSTFVGPFEFIQTSAGARNVLFAGCSFGPPTKRPVFTLTGSGSQVGDCQVVLIGRAVATGAQSALPPITSRWQLVTADAADYPLISSVTTQQLLKGTILQVGPLNPLTSVLNIVRGDDYFNADGRAFVLPAPVGGVVPSLIGAAVSASFVGPTNQPPPATGPAPAVTVLNAGGSSQQVMVEFGKATTAPLGAALYTLVFKATLADGSVVTFIRAPAYITNEGG